MNNDDGFDIPVVLFVFKRDKAVDIIKRLSIIKPKILYLLGDQGRNEKERKLVKSCRQRVEEAIDWPCKVVKYYADENRGVYENIAGGAKKVLSQEKWAIFLEDDNLPELSFFPFCKEMLIRYENDTRIMWICGTNYLGKYNSVYNTSYVFTRHMLPCGWASWSNKFEKFYNGDLSLCDDDKIVKNIQKNYYNKKLYKQYKYSWLSEYALIKHEKKPMSWDFQMDFSLKANNLVGICPCYNQIKNIGVDQLSEHGGSSFSNEMTKRFCGMDSFAMDFPLHHPKCVMIDPVFEKKIAKILLFPIGMRIKINISCFIKKIFHISYDTSLRDFIRRKNK